MIILGNVILYFKNYDGRIRTEMEVSIRNEYQ